MKLIDLIDDMEVKKWVLIFLYPWRVIYRQRRRYKTG